MAYNHKKQLVLTFLLGAMGGAAGMKVAYEQGVISVDRPPPLASPRAPRPALPQSQPPRASPPASKPPEPARVAPVRDEVIPAEKLCDLQELMSNIGTYTGRVDGIPGPNTTAAIKLAQRNLGFPETGVATVALLAKLQSAAAKPNGQRPARAYRPAGGEIIYESGKTRIAPLQIVSPPQSGDYLIKLQAPKRKTPELMFYVRGGQTVTVDVPLGTFELRYANGSQWQSQNCLFGMQTALSKARETFRFAAVGNQVSGYTVELIRQINGNLHTQKIDASEW